MTVNKRPTLIEENNSLKDSIKALQNQNSNLSLSNHELDKDNGILRERLSNFGLRDLCKSLGWVGIGAAIGEAINSRYFEAMIVSIVSSVLIMIFSIYDNFWSKTSSDKEKVGKT